MILNMFSNAVIFFLGISAMLYKICISAALLMLAIDYFIVYKKRKRRAILYYGTYKKNRYINYNKK